MFIVVKSWLGFFLTLLNLIPKLQSILHKGFEKTMIANDRGSLKIKKGLNNPHDFKTYNNPTFQETNYSQFWQ
jgi:hypothetical protein